MQAPSRPLLIGLLCVLAFAGVYFVALKPPGKGADSSSPYNAPIAQAKSAVSQSQAAAAKAQQAAGQTVSTTAASPLHKVANASATHQVTATKHVATAVKHTPVVAKKPVAAKKPASSTDDGLESWDRSKLVFAVLAQHHVAVMLFWTKGQSDDTAARKAVDAVKHKPGVRVFEIPMSHVGDYAAIATAASVSDSPTTLVIGPNHRFQTIIGYTYAGAVTQAIALARK